MGEGLKRAKAAAKLTRTHESIRWIVTDNSQEGALVIDPEAAGVEVPDHVFDWAGTVWNLGQDSLPAWIFVTTESSAGLRPNFDSLPDLLPREQVAAIRLAIAQNGGS